VLELSSTGRLVILVGASMLVLSFLLWNPGFLILAALVFLYLFWEGIWFRRALELARRCVKVYTTPSDIETIVGRRSLVETVVKNETPVNLRVVGVDLNLPDCVRSETRGTQLLLAPQQEGRIQTVLETEIPGRFDKAWSTVVFEMPSRLFRQHVSFPDKVTMIGEPMVGEAKPLFETSGLHDLVVDRVRRGVGTDLAGIRPANPWDGFHRIDWKVTARTGKLMSRDFYLEREPPIMLLIDTSASMRAKRNGGSLLSELVSEIADLLASSRPSAASPVGLVMFDERDVVAYVEPRSGQMNRDRVLQALVQRGELAGTGPSLQRETERPRAVLFKEIEALESEPASVSKAKPLYERYFSLVSRILPFYRTAASKRVSKLKKQGIFKAFEIVRRVPERVLVIAISDGKTNPGGLCEGARRAKMLGHRVVIAILSPDERNVLVGASELNSVGVRLFRCMPGKLWSAIDAELQVASHTRMLTDAR